MGKKKTSLLRMVMARFAVCMAALLLLAMPLFYWLTKNFYAEDMIDVIESVKNGRSVPDIDLAEDVVEGMAMQFGVISLAIGVAVVLTVRIISRRAWQPFYDTLSAVRDFRIDGKGRVTLPDTDIEEFSKLNASLARLMNDSRKSFRAQKEFTENASHELQTPLAVMRSKLDVLMQQPGITEGQASIIQDLCLITGRMARLNRNLLLLAKMENNQFDISEQVDVVTVVKELLPYLESLLGGIALDLGFEVGSLPLRANRPLLESMVSNLVVNAVRHNRKGGSITVEVTAGSLVVSNTSNAGRLDTDNMFNRFFRHAGGGKGNGLGLAIVKAVCDYHGWTVEYAYIDGMHHFIVKFV